ncbi:MAG TPA: glycosyltransferase family 2 protein, partial [Candidatus Marinimicrobia bacterium]|nr:glycosyltransferase family 2 protein [Candidatus Neomarinimicrobiota bacterium]
MNYPISLCMIVKNEAAVLERCLKSAAAFVQEIIIVDTGSTDKTKAIAACFGAKIFDFQWIEDFSAARNESLRHATQPWILHLDADEYLDIETVASLAEIGKNSKYAGYLVTIRNLHRPDDLAKSSDDAQIRLFRRQGNIYYMGAVHEQIGDSIEASGAKIDSLSLRIIHTGYQADPAIKASRNLPLLLLEAEKRPSAYVFFKLGETYKALKNYELAEHWLQKAADKKNGKLSSELYETLYLRLAQLALEKNQFQKAFDFAAKSNKNNNDNVISLYVGAIAALY